MFFQNVQKHKNHRKFTKKTLKIGDSGGPYTVERPGSPNRVQVSVHCFGASSGVGGCDAGWPSGSTRTTVFLDWIDINMIP